MNFSQALSLLKDGISVSRQGWHGKGMFLTLQRPDAYSKMTEPYIYITVPPQEEGNENEEIPTKRCPWLAAQSDLLATDWKVV